MGSPDVHDQPTDIRFIFRLPINMLDIDFIVLSHMQFVVI
jgi:hypothetical protein